MRITKNELLLIAEFRIAKSPACLMCDAIISHAERVESDTLIGKLICYEIPNAYLMANRDVLIHLEQITKRKCEEQCKW